MKIKSFCATKHSPDQLSSMNQLYGTHNITRTSLIAELSFFIIIEIILNTDSVSDIMFRSFVISEKLSRGGGGGGGGLKANIGKKWVKHMRCIDLKFTPIMKRVETFRDMENPPKDKHFSFVI